MIRPYIFILLIFLTSLFLWGEEGEILIPVPLYVDGEYSGEIALRINGQIQLQPRPLLEELAPLLEENQLEVDKVRWYEEEWVPLEKMAGAMVKVVFDEELVILRVTIPPESRKPGSYTLSSQRKIPSGNITRPAKFSGVLNFYGSAGIDYEEQEYDGEINPELVVNYSNFVTEIKGGVQTGSELFFLDYCRFTKDLPSLTARAMAGDLSYSGDGFLSESMVGLSLFRNTVLDYNYISSPELPKRIYFPEPADVEIYINEKRVKKISVPAGTWTFKHFPLSQGFNEIRILWSDSQGEQEQSFYQVYDGGLLKPYELDWGGSVGTDSWTTVNPAFLLHLSRGMSSTVTAGINSYYSLNDSNVSLNVPLLIASYYGTFSVIPEGESEGEGDYSVGVSVNHSYSEESAKGKRLNFGTSLEYSYEGGEDSYQSYYARGYYVHTPSEILTITPSVSWSYETDDANHGLDLMVRSRTKGSEGSSIAVELGVSLDTGEWLPQGAITYSASFPEIKQNIYVKGDIDDEKMILSWNRYNDSAKARDYTLGVSSSVPASNEDTFTFSVNGGYFHPFFLANISQGYNATFDTGEYSNSTSLSIGSALVFADGVMGVTRPVSGSFIIIDSEIGPMKINPSSMGSLMDIDGKRPGILTSVSSYNYTKLRMMPEVLPVGSDISDYTTSVMPTYRSGTLIRAEEKVYMYVGGVLIDSGGEPLTLILGDIIPASGVERAYEKGEWPREFFTDETGYFECYGLSPGEYLLTLKDEELTFIIEVTANESGYCELGVVSPEN
ncbi:MAG: hypothetical protein PQJ59_02280 [Spirochaetales bacterium]|nr:hypothetical protein [Spirochaetales bacterium]